jgi:hypothetical protein
VSGSATPRTIPKNTCSVCGDDPRAPQGSTLRKRPHVAAAAPTCVIHA